MTQDNIPESYKKAVIRSFKKNPEKRHLYTEKVNFDAYGNIES